MGDLKELGLSSSHGLACLPHIGGTRREASGRWFLECMMGDDYTEERMSSSLTHRSNTHLGKFAHLAHLGSFYMRVGSG